MTAALARKTGNVYVADPRMDQRTAVRDAVKQLGFADTKVVGSIKEVWDMLEVDDKPVDWIICSLMAEEEFNALHLLALFVQSTRLHGCRVSLLVAPEDVYALTGAFELGLLSWHKKPFTQGTLVVELQDVLNRLAADDTGGCITAAHYFRTHLQTSEDYEGAIALDESLIHMYPGKADLFLNLAEAQHLAGKKDAALKTIAQAQHMDPRVAKGAKQLLDMLRQEDGAAAPVKTDYSFAEIFNLKTAVTIDADDTIQKMLHETLTAFGIPNILQFSDGVSAWEYIEKNATAIDLIIQEWRLHKLSAPALIQRYREQAMTTPVVVFSSLVKKEDQSLLREMGVAQVIQKPLDKDLLISELMATVRQERFPTAYRTVERQMRQALTKRDLPASKELYKNLTAIPETPESLRRLMEAELLYAEGNYEGAKSIAFEVMKTSRDSLSVLNLLGKIYMKMRNFDDAIKCLNKAQQMSSSNLERLCLLAEAQGEQGDVSAAKSTLDQAKQVDSGSKTVIATEIKVALTAGDAGTAKSLVAKMDSLSGIVAFMNNRAVSLSRQGELKEAINLYETALKSLPESEKSLMATINYNLSLSHVRAGDMKKASGHAETAAAAVPDSAIGKKAGSIKTRLDQAIAKNQVIQIKAEEETADRRDAKNADAASMPSPPAPLVAIDVRPGEMCCHLVYSSKGGFNEQVMKLLARMPRFKERAHQTLQREKKAR